MQAALSEGRRHVVEHLLANGATENIATLKGHKGSVRAVAFSPNSQLVATASKDRTARLWNVKTGEKLLLFADHEDYI